MTFPIKINDHWRITKDNLQWIMQKRTAKKDGTGFSGWQPHWFVHSKRIVERTLEEEGETYPADALNALPDKFIRK